MPDNSAFYLNLGVVTFSDDELELLNIQLP